MTQTRRDTFTDRINIHLIRWDEDILRSCYSCETPEEKKTGKAYLAKAVSRLTGVYASMLFYDGGRPERLISHYENGKPYMEGLEHLTVSISHSGSTAAVSVSHLLHGIDIEKPRQINQNIIKYVFTEDEKAVYAGSSSVRECENYFFTIWSRKEALIKTGAITLSSMTAVSAGKAHIFYKAHDYWWDTVKRGEYYISLCCRDMPLRIEISEEDRTAQLAARQIYNEFYDKN